MNEFFYEPTVKVLMLKGEKGKGIVGIEKTGTSGFIDTYTVKFDDGTVSTFTVTNGKEISDVSKTGTSGLVDTYTISFNDGTTETFTVTNGEKGDKGDKGDQGIQGIQGIQGEKGDTGAGTPTGGTAGQYLQKKSDADYDYEWADVQSFDPLSVYPVGSIYLSVNSTNPSELFGGTWQSIGSGRVLQGADDTHAAGSTIEAGLPNITGKLNRNYGESNQKDAVSGVFARTDGYAKTWNAEWTAGNNVAVSFDASRSSSVYGKSDTVQPPAFVVNIWVRTA